MSIGFKHAIFSSSDEASDEDSQDLASDSSNENDSEAVPWRELIHEAALIIRPQYDELLETYQSEDMEVVMSRA